MKKYVSLMLAVILTVNCTFCVLAGSAISLGSGETTVTLSQASTSDATSEGELKYNKYCTYNFTLETSGSYKISVVSKANNNGLLATVFLGSTEKFTSPIPKSTQMQETEIGVLDIPAGSQTFKFGIKYTADGNDSLNIDSFVFERISDVTELSLASVSDGVTNNKPATSMNVNSYANYSFDAQDGTYAVYVTTMANSVPCEITASIGNVQIGSKSFNGIGWDSRYSREYYVGSVDLTEGSNQIKFKNTGANSLRLWSVRLKFIPKATADAFIGSVNNSKTTDAVENILSEYSNLLVIPYSDYLDDICYKDIILKKISKYPCTSLVDLDTMFVKWCNEETENPLVRLEQNGVNVTTLSEGELKVICNPKLAKTTQVVAAIYNSDYTQLKSSDIGTLTTSEPLELTKLTVSDETDKFKIFFLENLDNVRPAEIFVTKTTLFVSPDGDDKNSGLTLDDSLETIDAAINKARQLNTSYPRDIVISLGSGEYVLDDTIVFDEALTPHASYSVKFVSQNSQNPAVISGGTDVTKWSDDNNDGIYIATVPNTITDVRQLYIDGYPAQRARSEEYIYAVNGWDNPNTTEYAQDGFYVDTDVVSSFSKPEDVEVAYSIKWALQRLPVDNIVNNGDGTSTVKMTQPYYSTAYTMICGGGVQPKTNNKVYFENDLSLLDREGEFYFDKSTNKIYYMPFDGESLNSVRTVISTTEKLIEAKGSSVDNKIKNITFENISFKYGGYYTEPNTEGTVVFQAETLVDYEDGLNADPNKYGRDLLAQIEFENADNINFINCDISAMGSTALRLGLGVTNSKVQGCVFTDIGGSALSVGHRKASTSNLTTDITINNNVISRTGLDFMSSPAVSIYYAKNVDVLHNDISDTPYSGMSVGWGWAWDYVLDYQTDTKTSTPSGANKLGVGGHNISYNRIDGISNALNDGGHIYNLGYMTATTITNNYLLNSPDAGGVYLDTGASNIAIRNNVFKNCERDSVAYGRSEHAVNNVAQSNWSDSPQVKTLSWPGTNCLFNAPTLITGNNWPAEATSVMENAGVESTYAANLARKQKPSWRTLDFFAHLEREKLPEGSIAIDLKYWAACRLNSTSATAPTFDNIFRHYTLENMYPRDAIIYEFNAPAAGKYYLEIGYSTEGTYTAAVAVNKNLKQNHYNSTTGTYVWNKAGCTYFDSSNSTTEKFALVPSNSSSPIGRIYRIASPYALNAGTNELYLGCTSISGASTVTIKSLRFIPVSE